MVNYKTSTKRPDLISYTYSLAGQLVSKTANGIATWYIADAEGNVLAIYDKRMELSTGANSTCTDHRGLACDAQT
jgi:hypothetical protein